MAAALTVISTTGSAASLDAISANSDSPAIYERLEGDSHTDMTRLSRAVQKQKQQQKQQQKAALAAKIEVESGSEGGFIV